MAVGQEQANERFGHDALAHRAQTHGLCVALAACGFGAPHPFKQGFGQHVKPQRRLAFECSPMEGGEPGCVWVVPVSDDGLADAQIVIGNRHQAHGMCHILATGQRHGHAAQQVALGQVGRVVHFVLRFSLELFDRQRR